MSRLCNPKYDDSRGWFCECCGFDSTHPKAGCKAGQKLNRFSRECERPCLRGLGDLFERLLLWIGIKKKPGCGCKRRQAWLNWACPFKSTLSKKGP